MAQHIETHQRKSIRLQGYDYARTGAYFVTVCTHKKACLLGNIAGNDMCLNDAGLIVQKWWYELNYKFPHIETDDHVVMPNHFHGIITITTVGADLCVCPPTDTTRSDGYQKQGFSNGTHSGGSDPKGAHTGAPLPKIMQWLKTMTTNEYIRGVKTGVLPPFAGRFWQRNYYEHIIRNDASLNRIRQYIVENPRRWSLDRENPAAAHSNGPHPKEEPWMV